MNVLAFDTCFDACSVAAGRGLRSLSPAIVTLFEPMQSGQAERLVPMIEQALQLTGLTVAELDCIAVTQGPGTFTGTRITTAAARALSLFFQTPLVSMSTLRLMALNFNACAAGARSLAVATDARRSEVYFELFDAHTLETLVPATAMTIAQAANELGEEPTVVVGSGARAVVQLANELGKTAHAQAECLLPDAVDMLFEAMTMPRVNTVQAQYLRPADAKPQIDAALART